MGHPKPDHHKSEQRSEYKTEKKSEHKQEQKYDHKPEHNKPEQKSEHKPEQKSEHKPEHNPEHKPEDKSEHNPEHKQEDKCEHNLEHKPEDKCEHNPEHKPEDNCEHNPEHKPEDKCEHNPEHQSDHKLKPPSVSGGPCKIEATVQVPLTNLGTNLYVGTPVMTTIKVPVVTVEPTLQIVVESTITLEPAATEIKRVKKNVFLEQVKLVPVAFTRIDNTDFFYVCGAKLFVAGHIRKNIEYSSHECNGALQDRIADVPFAGFTDITSFTNPPIIGISEAAEANFLNEQTNLSARLDKAFFQNLIKYNEQPYGELVAANFFELDFSPTQVSPEGTFCTLREKIVLDLTLKVLQVQQLRLTASPVIPVFSGLTPPATP